MKAWFRYLTALCALVFAFPAQAAKVELRALSDGAYQLIRDGQPFFIKGAGGQRNLSLLQRCGANTVRTWGSDQTETVLPEAQRLGLAVCAGLWVEHGRHGVDYGDPAVAAAEIAKHTRAVDRFKDHPSLLLWGVGNEVEAQNANPKVWEVVEAIAAHIKKVDPNHPVMTVTAHATPAVVAEILRRCPSVDILGCNSYSGLEVLARDVRAAGWKGPYLVTEWGNDGNWEVKKTSWGAELEPTSSQKAAQFAKRYPLIVADGQRCLGSLAFFWDQKQETTPTWFNLFTESGRRTEAIEVLAKAWGGRVPEPKAPKVGPIVLNGKEALPGLSIRPFKLIRAEIEILEGQANKVVWQLYPESAFKGFGGDAERRPEQVPAKGPMEIIRQKRALSFSAPATPGAYRLFAYVNGPSDTAATANVPFLVKE
jgi:hypothetical protein